MHRGIFDDIMVYGNFFYDCLHNLALVMKHCIETNLVRHFMASQGIVLSHLVFARGIEVDKTKFYVISNLS